MFNSSCLFVTNNVGNVESGSVRYPTGTLKSRIFVFLIVIGQPAGTQIQVEMSRTPELNVTRQYAESGSVHVYMCLGLQSCL